MGEKKMRKMLFALLVLGLVIVMGSPAMAEDPSFKGIAYIQGHGGHIALVDLATGETARYVHGKPSDALILSADGNTMYTFSLDGFSKETDIKTGKSTEWQQLGKKHCGSAYAPDGKIWVSDMADGNVYIYDPKTHKPADTFNVSKSTCGIAFSKDGKLAYVSDMPGGFVSIVDVATKKVTGKIDAGIFIHRSRIRPGTSELWQSDGAEVKGGDAVGVGYAENNGIPGMVTILDVAAKKKIDTLLVGGNPHDVDFSADGKYAFIAVRQIPEMDDSAIVVVDAATKRVVKMYSACKSCHGAIGFKIPATADNGKPFLCAITINWKQTEIPKTAERSAGAIEKSGKPAAAH
jgi:YVTN family beta-propeller protein